jgi:hypothetical protein
MYYISIHVYQDNREFAMITGIGSISLTTLAHSIPGLNPFLSGAGFRNSGR